MIVNSMVKNTQFNKAQAIQLHHKSCQMSIKKKINQILYFWFFLPPRGEYKYLIVHLLKLACQERQNPLKVLLLCMQRVMLSIGSISLNNAAHLKYLQKHKNFKYMNCSVKNPNAPNSMGFFQSSQRKFALILYKQE